MNDATVDILLVEDNANDIELALYAFSKNGLDGRTRTVRDGEEALEFLFCEGRHSGRLPQEGPKIVLLDLKLPKFDGLMVLRKIKEDPRTKKIPIIALTTSHESSDVATAYEYGTNSYIVKPVEFDEFSATITAISRYWLSLNYFPTLRHGQ